MTSEQATPKAMIIHILIIVSVSCYALQSNLSCNEGPLEFIATSPGCCSGGECEGHVGGSVCFSCAAKNFCSVDWLKDDQLSYLCNSTDGHYYCLDEDTTLYINSLFPKAKGNYTCELSNSTHTISREFILGMICEVFIEDENFIPVPQQLDDGRCSDMQAEVGTNVTLYCEFCAKMRYNETSLEWKKWIKNGNGIGDWVPVEELDIKGTSYRTERKELSNCGLSSSLNPDPDCQTETDSVGSFLYIDVVTEETYGLYKVFASLQDENNVSSTDSISLSPETHPIHDRTGAVLGSLAGCLLVILVAAVLYHNFNLDVRLFIRDRFGETENKGQRSNDAFIVYDSASDEDRNFVLKVIRPVFAENNYEVFIKDIDTIGGSFYAEELLEAMDNSLRCILLISQSFLSSKHTILQINKAINDMSQERTKIIPVLFGDVNIMETGGHHGLSRLLLVLRCLRYKEGQTKQSKFLKRLLLRMPRRDLN
ncbi:interleukin-1 receptor accessory protein-like 1-B isoform X2 [Apostichopus japonicus]|uniref:interleukin-1 receptor accessory protein-like 1-B isoform X2 n=1 Tax=Stichopus japonicus TaxID=307972 RepID=UPI003AB8C066